MKYTRVFTDAQGETHFEDVSMETALVEYIPGSPPVGVSSTRAATGITFYRIPAGWEGKPHPVPRRQFSFILSGTQEITTSDGQSRLFGPGCVLLLEDTQGDGHLTRVADPEDCQGAVLPLDGSG